MQKLQRRIVPLARMGLLLLYFLLVFGGCQHITLRSSSPTRSTQAVAPSASDITLEIMDRLQMNDMLSISKENLSSYFDIDVNNLEDYSFWVSSSEGSADELAVFQSSDPNFITQIREAVSKHISSKEDGFKNLDPAEYQKVKNAVLVEDGSYVFLAVCNDPETASKTFESYAKNQ